MKITKETLSEYLRYGLIDKGEVDLILKNADSNGINENLRFEIIEILERNIKSNESEIEEIEKEFESAEKAEKESIAQLKNEASLKSKDLAKERLEHYKLVKKQQVEIMRDFDLEMDRLDRKLGETVSAKKKDFEISLMEKIRQKLHS